MQFASTSVASQTHWYDQCFIVQSFLQVVSEIAHRKWLEKIKLWIASVIEKPNHNACLFHKGKINIDFCSKRKINKLDINMGCTKNKELNSMETLWEMYKNYLISQLLCLSSHATRTLMKWEKCIGQFQICERWHKKQTQVWWVYPHQYHYTNHTRDIENRNTLTRRQQNLHLGLCYFAWLNIQQEPHHILGIRLLIHFYITLISAQLLQSLPPFFWENF